MNKPFLIALYLLCTLTIACKKSASPDTTQNTSDKYKLTLLSGDNQSDTLGHYLKDSVIIKATNNGVPLKNYHVQFQGSGCNDDLIDDYNTTAQGMHSYMWRLAGDIGKQTLKVRLLDAQNKVLDSLNVTSTGIAPGRGWHLSACTPFTSETYRFCKLSTGRLLVCCYKNYVRYSDDNGISWTAIKSLGNNHAITAIVSTPKDELIADAEQEGFYYSKDAGATWTLMGPTPSGADSYEDMAYTPSGRLIYTTQQGHSYLSTDMGKSWKTLNAGLGNTVYHYPSETSNGDLYLVGHDEYLYKSTDGGNSWQAQTNYSRTISFYIGPNGWQYQGRLEPDGGLFVSKDNGASYTRLINVSNSFVFKPLVTSTGSIYYNLLFSGLYVFDGNSSKKLVDDEFAGNGLSYIIAKNNNIIVWPNNPFIHYYIP
jgi:hypothetical protein